MKLFVFFIAFFLWSCVNYSTYNLAQLDKSELKLFDNGISKYGLNDGDTLLDVGSGYGYHSARIFRYYPNMFFVLEDIEIKYAKENRGFVVVNGKSKYFKDNSKYVNGIIDSILLPNSTHKLILCRKTLHEFTNPIVMLKELRRILTSDGILIIEEAIPKIAEEIDPYCKMKHLSKDEIIKLLTVNNFKFLSADSTTFPIKNKNEGNFNILKFSK